MYILRNSNSLESGDAIGWVGHPDLPVLTNLAKIKPANFDDYIPASNTKTYPSLVYYNDDHSGSPECTKAMSELLQATYTLPSTWQQLVSEIERGQDKIVFHYDVIVKSGGSVKDFIQSVNTITKCMSVNRPLKIFVLITPYTTKRQVQELRAAGVLGLGYDVRYYSYKQSAEATRHLIAGKPYWPDDIINQLPNPPEKIKHILFRPDAGQYMTPEIVAEFRKYLDFDFYLCENWTDLSEAINQGARQMVVHVGMLEHLHLSVSEIVDLIRTLSMLADLEVAVMVAIEPTTSLKFVKELKKTGVLGINPTMSHWGIVESVQSAVALTNRQPHWPKHILDQLPDQTKRVAELSDAITLTPRQQQVFHQITERGASNKGIARSLGISESAVKLHVTEIFKKYGVKSRTQLAVFAGH